MSCEGVTSQRRWKALNKVNPVVENHYQTTIGEDTAVSEDLVCAVVICKVYKLLR
jgi:hypothetical protein